MRKLRISPSTLSQFCAFQTAKFEGAEWEVTAEKLAAYLKGEKQFSNALTKGYAFHKLLEHGTEGFKQADGSLRVHSTSKDATVHFDNYTRRVVDRYRELNPDMIHEVPCQLKMSCMGHEIVSNMRIDGIYPFPSRLHDFKTSTASYRVTEGSYYDSVQWRMYLLACDDVDVFQYDIFHFQDNCKDAVRSLEYYNFQFWRESDMEKTIWEWVQGLINFCEYNNLLDYITVRQ